MPDLADGESIQMQGSGREPYTIKNLGGVYSCTCPAWRNQSVGIDVRTCKHRRSASSAAFSRRHCGTICPCGSGSRRSFLACSRSWMACWSIAHGGTSSAVPSEVAMQLIIDPSGHIRCLYSEEINLAVLGQLSIRRGSHVEPNEHGQWLCDLFPVSGPTLGPFASRSSALAADRDVPRDPFLDDPLWDDEPTYSYMEHIDDRNQLPF